MPQTSAKSLMLFGSFVCNLFAVHIAYDSGLGTILTILDGIIRLNILKEYVHRLFDIYDAKYDDYFTPMNAFPRFGSSPLVVTLIL